MITIQTNNGKYFFSIFLNLTEESSGEVDETQLKENDLKSLLLAKISGRVIISEEDTEKINKILLEKTSSGSPIDLSGYVTSTKLSEVLSSKSDKFVTEVIDPVKANTANSLPLYTLDNGGNYILCTPDHWVHIGENMYIPAYNKSTINKD